MGRFPHFFSLLPIFSLAVIFLSTTIAPPQPAAALPLSTDSRWIVDETGRRVKLSCVNWASHLDAVVAEGLSKQPIDSISKKIVSMGFNCVRLTWPLFLATNDSLANTTVRQSFRNLGLIESIAGFQVNNPSIIDHSLISAFQAVVSSLGDNNVMVILDNHISKPGWCCSKFGGSGFFGDQYFNPDLWIKGLTIMASLFKGTPNVVGMSLRNELRGPKENVNDWYRYMQKGAEMVHAINPDVLVILSGLSFDKDLSFLLNRPMNLTFTGKLVFEVHWYGFSDGSAWKTGNPNQVCGQVVDQMMRKAGFVLDQGYPLFMSEFGVDLRGTNDNDNRYLNCFLGVAAELDLDWALWTLAGSYYLREGVIGLEEFYGVFNWNWCEARNSSFLERISAIQSPFQVIFLSTTITPPNPAAAAIPLSTDSRWLVDETGRRVKLSCVSWASHLEAVVAEGLSKQPIDTISKKIVSMGFNCVRLTWPLFLATNDSLASTTVRHSFMNLRLIDSIAGFQANNPSIIDLSLINAYQKIDSKYQTKQSLQKLYQKRNVLEHLQWCAIGAAIAKLWQSSASTNLLLPSLPFSSSFPNTVSKLINTTI